MRGIFGRQSGNGAGFSHSTFGFTLSVSFHRCSIFIFHSSRTNTKWSQLLTVSLKQTHKRNHIFLSFGLLTKHWTQKRSL